MLKVTSSIVILFFSFVGSVNSQALEALRPTVSPQDKQLYAQAIGICKAIIRERTRNPELQIYEPCQDSDGNWPGVERLQNGYRFQLSVKPKKSEHAAFMSALIGETVRVVCSTDINGKVVAFEDHKETLAELRSMPSCGYFRD